MKPASLTVEIDGHPLVLSSLRASFGPALRCQFAADARFGKDAVFRARGIPVPIGSTADDLMRVDILIVEFGPGMIVFLGDLLHVRDLHASRRSMRCMPGVLGMRICVWCWWMAITIGMRARCRVGWVSSRCGSLGMYDRGRCVISRGGWTARMRLRVTCIRSIRSRRGPIQFGCRVSGSERSVVCCRLLGAFKERRVAGEKVFLVVQERVIDVGVALG
jgi:hypothetical protein